MNLEQFFAILKASAWSIVMMGIVGAGVAWALASSQPNEYVAKARVMLNIGNDDANQMSAINGKSQGSYINTEMRLVTDDAVARQVVEKLGWPNDPQVIAAWQAATGGAGDVETWLGHRLAANISVQQLEDSSIIEIYYEAPSVDIAKQIVALVRTAYIDNSLSLRSAAARRAAAWNETVATKALAELHRAEAERVKFLAANQIAIDSSAGSLEMMELTRDDPSGPPANVGTSTSSPELVRLRSRLAAIDAEVAVLKLNGDNNPATLAAIVQRDQIAAQLARETSFAQAGAGATVAQIAANRALRGSQYIAARLRVLDRASTYDKLAQLDREITLKTALYRAAAARVSIFDTIAAAPSGMNVIGDVIAQDDPVFPNVPLAVGLAAAASLGLGIAVTLLGEMLRRMVRGAEDLRFYSQVPVLAVIAGGSRPRRSRRWSFRRVVA